MTGSTIPSHLVVREPHGELDGDDLDDVLDGVEFRQHGGRVGHHNHAVVVLVPTDAQPERKWDVNAFQSS